MTPIEAMHAKLSADATVTGLLSTFHPWTAIYQAVPQAVKGEDDAEFPYISFAREVETPYDDKAEIGGNHLVQIDVWTRERGLTQARAIGSAVKTALHRQSLDVAGWIDTQVETKEETADPDGKTKRCLLLVRVLYLA